MRVFRIRIHYYVAAKRLTFIVTFTYLYIFIFIYSLLKQSRASVIKCQVKPISTRISIAPVFYVTFD